MITSCLEMGNAHTSLMYLFFQYNKIGKTDRTDVHRGYPKQTQTQKCLSEYSIFHLQIPISRNKAWGYTDTSSLEFADVSSKEDSNSIQ